MCGQTASTHIRFPVKDRRFYLKKTGRFISKNRMFYLKGQDILFERTVGFT